MMELMATCFECDCFCQHEMSVFQEPPGKPEVYFSKQPNDIRYIRHILLRDENLFVIHMQRDPRSVVTSEHKSQPGIYFCNFRAWQACHLAARKLQGHERFLLVRYEDLTATPDVVQGIIEKRFAFLKRKYAFSSYQDYARPSAESAAAMSGLRAITANRQRNWETHLPRLKDQMQRHPELGEVLVECSYETDDTWTRILEAVEPRDFPCRYPNRPSPWKTLETRVRKYFQSRSYLARRRLQT